MPHKSIGVDEHLLIHQYAREGLKVSQIMQKTGFVENTVRKYLGMLVPLPKTEDEPFDPFVIERGVYWRALLMMDIHIPFHVTKAVNQAIRYGKAAKCNLIILNGDIFDQHNVSKYPHDGSALTYISEIRRGQQLLAHLRQEFPKARIVLKEGNHEERLEKYILGRGPAIFGIKECTLQSLVKSEDYGIEWVRDQRVIHAGKLRIIHGHEYGSGSSAPVNAARWLMLRARKHALCGHLHHTSEQIESNIDGEELCAWSVGCLCGLSPKYRRLNARWNQGFAVLDIEKNGEFDLNNQRIRKGKIA